MYSFNFAFDFHIAHTPNSTNIPRRKRLRNTSLTILHAQKSQQVLS